MINFLIKIYCLSTIIEFNRIKDTIWFMEYEASYIKLLKNGELQRRADYALELLQNCKCCPHYCKVDRTAIERGKCLSGTLPIVSSYSSHFGEEPVLSGTKGAGNIFFGNCNLKCIYCQNYEISQNWKNEITNEVSFEFLAYIMIELQERGCHNIGFVSPTHFTPAILKSISIAAEKGLFIPLVYNSNGYDSVEMLKLLDGVVDIYLPDFKYGEDEYAKKYSLAENYFESAKAAIKEMYRQVGAQLIYNGNVITRGLIIRHLVLPNGLAESEKVFKFIAEELSSEINISLMAQYFPAHKAKTEILLSRGIKEREYEKVVCLLEKYDLQNGWIQGVESSDYYVPNFNNDRKNPFKN